MGTMIKHDSKFVNELIFDLMNNPDTFKAHNGGAKKGNLEICNIGLYFFCFSTTMVFVNKSCIDITNKDAINLTRAVREWFKLVSLESLLQTTD